MSPRWVVSDFEWDPANVDHLWDRHQVAPDEVEEVFVGPFKMRKGRLSKGEQYYEALGPTLSGRHLFVVFLIRTQRVVRAVSARPMTKAERKWYVKP